MRSASPGAAPPGAATDRATDACHRTPLSSLVTVVIATRDRREQLAQALHHLLDDVDAPERPAVIVVDNASGDDTVARTRSNHPDVQVLALDRNEGAVARNIGVATAATPFVAFNDDDSWWAPGGLRHVADVFDQHARLGLVAARVLFGPEARLDPVSEVMGRSPLEDGRATAAVPGCPVLGFLACAAAVRRTAFLEAGGFSRTLFFYGEEAVLAMDLAAAGWALRYDDRLVVHHHPVGYGRAPRARVVQQRRNELLTAWMRRPATRALQPTIDLVRDARADPAARAALASAARAAPSAWRERRVVPPEVEADLRLLERPEVPGPQPDTAHSGSTPDGP